MTDLVKTKAPEIWAEIEKAQNILLHCHVRPDPDSVGSSLALKLVLKKMNKNATLIWGDDLPIQSLQFLTGWDQIQIKNMSDIKLDDYDLFISLDSGSPSQITRKVDLNFPLEIPTIVIDHHPTNPQFGNINLVASDYSSCSEIVTHLLMEKDSTLIDSDIATALYTGMWSDTGGFRFNLVTSDSYRTAAYLIDKGADFTVAIRNLTQINFRNLVVYGKALASAKELFSGQVVVVHMPLSIFENEHITDDEIGLTKAQVAFYLSQCDAKISIVIYEYEKNKINASFRVGNPAVDIDVTKIVTPLGGGGHKAAAGAKFENDSIENVEKKLIETINKIYPNLGNP